MKIAVINGAAPGTASEIINLVLTETLVELGEEVLRIGLDTITMPYFSYVEREKAAEVQDTIFQLMAADGVVFVAPTMLGGLSALMKTFMEHFAAPRFAHALLDKNCMVVSTPEVPWVDGRETFETMSRIIGALGGCDAVRAYLPYGALEDPDARIYLEKQTEDYYRIMRQGRKFYLFQTKAPTEVKAEVAQESVADQNDDLLVQEIKERIQHQDLTEDQEVDVSEIAHLVTERINNPEQEKPITPVIRPRNKTCKQLTANMPHYFNPQLSAGMRTHIAISINGSENFGATITIDGTNCHHDDGALPEAEMQINADAKVWTDILTGKLSAQKAFMVGQLKVRGNFLLLTKMDQLFNKMEL